EAGSAREMEAARRRSNSLESIALASGGLSSSSNDFLKALHDFEADSRGYYILGYCARGSCGRPSPFRPGAMSETGRPPGALSQGLRAPGPEGGARAGDSGGVHGARDVSADGHRPERGGRAREPVRAGQDRKSVV